MNVWYTIIIEVIYNAQIMVSCTAYMQCMLYMHITHLHTSHTCTLACMHVMHASVVLYMALAVSMIYNYYHNQMKHVHVVECLAWLTTIGKVHHDEVQQTSVELNLALWHRNAIPNACCTVDS